NSIAGFDAMAEGKAETLSGIEVLDDYTVKITLSAPNATFLHVMAINFASVVPREEAEKWGADFGKHPVGTGAFTLAD
ncbi:ABC transporter substrate-binding protein, partial [Pseudomonas aeruginosa]